MERSHTTPPMTLSPEYIEAYLDRANRLAAYCFAAQGLDGQLRVDTRHDARNNVPHTRKVGSSRLLMGEG